MKRFFVMGLALLLGMAGLAFGQKDKDDEPTSYLYFSIVRDENGKPVRNAAVVMHPVNVKGQQERGGLELKTDADGKASFDGIPYGKLRVQVLAHGFQTFGEDFDVDKAKQEIIIKLKRPQTQYSIYGTEATPSAPTTQPPPPEQHKKPN